MKELIGAYWANRDYVNSRIAISRTGKVAD